jgi:hypothetical protein
MTGNEPTVRNWRTRWPVWRISSVIFVVSLVAAWGYRHFAGGDDSAELVLSGIAVVSLLVSLMSRRVQRYRQTRKFLKETPAAATANKRAWKWALIGTCLIAAGFAWGFGVYTVLPRGNEIADWIALGGMLLLSGAGMLCTLYWTVARQNITWTATAPRALAPEGTAAPVRDYSARASFIRQIGILGLAFLSVFVMQDAAWAEWFCVGIVFAAILAWPPVDDTYEFGWRNRRSGLPHPAYRRSWAVWFDALFAAALFGGCAVLIFARPGAQAAVYSVIAVCVCVGSALILRIVQLTRPIVP